MLIIFHVCCTVVLALAAPTLPTQPNYDVDLLQSSLMLKQAESAFYKEGLNKFGVIEFALAGQKAWVRERITEIAYQERVITKLLIKTIKDEGAVPVLPCEYNFAYSDVVSFITTARVLEGIGAATYINANKFYTNAKYREYADSVLAVEAQHSAFLRGDVSQQDPFPQPLPAPLDFIQAYTLAAPSIVKCPASNPPIPIQPFPALELVKAIDVTGHVKTQLSLCSSDQLFLSTKAKLDYTKPVWVNFMCLQGAISIQFKQGEPITVPDDPELYGQIYVILSSKEGAIDDKHTLAGPLIIDVPLQNRDFGI